MWKARQHSASFMQASGVAVLWPGQLLAIQTTPNVTFVDIWEKLAVRLRHLSMSSRRVARGARRLIC